MLCGAKRHLLQCLRRVRSFDFASARSRRPCYRREGLRSGDLMFELAPASMDKLQGLSFGPSVHLKLRGSRAFAVSPAAGDRCPCKLDSSALRGGLYFLCWVCWKESGSLEASLRKRAFASNLTRICALGNNGVQGRPLPSFRSAARPALKQMQRWRQLGCLRMTKGPACSQKLEKLAVAC